MTYASFVVQVCTYYANIWFIQTITNHIPIGSIGSFHFLLLSHRIPAADRSLKHITFSYRLIGHAAKDIYLITTVYLFHKPLNI